MINREGCRKKEGTSKGEEDEAGGMREAMEGWKGQRSQKRWREREGQREWSED